MNPPSVPGYLQGINLKPRDVNEALAALDEASLRMRRARDFRAVFPDVYGVITRLVAAEINGDTGFFHEPKFISRLAGCFSERYFETLLWSLQRERQDCTAWSVAYDYGERRATIPFQDAILGISAHINFDLAQGIFKTIVEVGADRDAVRIARFKHDHDAVNDILHRAMPECFENLMERYGCRTSRVLWNRLRWPVRPLTMRTLEVWRAHVWEDVVRLLQAKGEPGRAPILVDMEERSGRMGRFFCAGSEALLRGRPIAAFLARLGPARSFDAFLERLPSFAR